jgi:hypothetical protein
LIILVLVPFRRMTADHATSRPSEETVTGGMTGHTPERRDFYAALGVGGSSRESKRERQDIAAKSCISRAPLSLFQTRIVESKDGSTYLMLAGHARRAAPHRSSVGSPCDTGDASWRGRSSNFCDSLVPTHGQIPFCRPLDRNWGGGNDRRADDSHANQSQFFHDNSPMRTRPSNHGGSDKSFD